MHRAAACRDPLEERCTPQAPCPQAKPQRPLLVLPRGRRAAGPVADFGDTSDRQTGAIPSPTAAVGGGSPRSSPWPVVGDWVPDAPDVPDRPSLRSPLPTAQRAPSRGASDPVPACDLP